ncbi:hypothetical protein H8S59_03215 [Pseudomonas sp. DOAB1069]|uniref:Uncharacterized protein n=1 Tax=Pseudomonas folii TaxID=2762593 RepID=A0ABR7AV34_9PSED|nr:hypothetical protein [Pseudomonas folii]
MAVRQDECFAAFGSSYRKACLRVRRVQVRVQEWTAAERKSAAALRYLIRFFIVKLTLFSITSAAHPMATCQAVDMSV